jgi:septal ring factor EnvC (AmiA/AmiB activator)|tara:strand:+ start:373 stop:573 length:201 start_codon:yes stop_codon:yes gene_type:complete
MSEVKVKANGLRNELKEIRKSIDKLTNAIIKIHIAQTNKHNESNNNDTCCNDDELFEYKRNKPEKI